MNKPHMNTIFYFVATIEVSDALALRLIYNPKNSIPIPHKKMVPPARA